MSLVSIVVPVHNGEHKLHKLMRSLLHQTYSNIEIILVENFSKDQSYAKCQKLSQLDCRVISLQSFKKGTSQARKLGVEQAKGEYIIFCDQDDWFVDNFSIEKMVKTIKHYKTDIVQFGHYDRYKFGMKYKKKKTNEIQIIYRTDSRYVDLISGVVGNSESVFGPHVWNKIYKTNVAKDAVKTIDETLYFAEDVNLNYRCFLSKKVYSVMFSPEAFYVWNLGIGFSSKTGSGEALLKDYEVIKPLILRRFIDEGASTKVLMNFCIETVYCYREVIRNKLKAHDTEATIKSYISYCEKSPYLIEAKDYLRLNECPEVGKWEELEYLISDYSVDSYYSYICSLPNESPYVIFIKKIIKKIISN